MQPAVVDADAIVGRLADRVCVLCTGAGTVIVSKGDITVGGITVKEWQRTPCKLLEEYCQANKRPMPMCV